MKKPLSDYYECAELFLANDENQLWFRRDDKGWDVLFFDGRYRSIAQENWKQIPEYAVTGRSEVSSDGVIEKEFISNKQYDECKIISCDVWR